MDADLQEQENRARLRHIAKVALAKERSRPYYYYMRRRRSLHQQACVHVFELSSLIDRGVYLLYECVECGLSLFAPPPGLVG